MSSKKLPETRLIFYCKQHFGFLMLPITSKYNFQIAVNTSKFNLLVFKKCPLFYGNTGKCAYPGSHHQWEYREEHALVPLLVMTISPVITGTSRSLTLISAMVTVWVIIPIYIALQSCPVTLSMCISFL